MAILNLVQNKSFPGASFPAEQKRESKLDRDPGRILQEVEERQRMKLSAFLAISGDALSHRGQVIA